MKTVPRNWLIICLGLIFLSVATQTQAFVYQIETKSKSEISQLSDDALVDTYINVLVEVEASTTFHQTSGFRPQDYEKHKNLLKYRLLLKQEIIKRKLAAPDIGSPADLQNPESNSQPQKSQGPGAVMIQ
jgi:hypothetical protein